MIRNILLSAFASLKRKKMASLFTILTISLGMTMIILILALLRMETGNVGPNVNYSNSLFMSKLVNIKNGNPVITKWDKKYASPDFVIKHLKSLQTAADVCLYSGNREINIGSKLKPREVKLLITDDRFWKIYDFKLLEGRFYNALEIENRDRVCVITSSVADYLFNGKALDKDILGRRVIGVIRDEHYLFEVAASVYIPYTQFNEEMIPNIEEEEYPNLGRFHCTILAHQRSDFKAIQAEFRKKMDLINATNFENKSGELNAKLLKATEYKIQLEGFDKTITIVIIPFLLGLIFLVPILTLLNINSSALIERLEEIGIKKTFGALRKHIIFQFLAEFILITLFSSVIGFALTVKIFSWATETLVPGAGATGFKIDMWLVLYIVAGAIVFAIISGVWPVVRISRLKPVNILSPSTTGFNERRKSRKWGQLVTYILLFLVFSFSTLVFTELFRETHLSPGYNDERVVGNRFFYDPNIKIQAGPDDQTMKKMKNELLKHPFVKSVAFTNKLIPDRYFPDFPEWIVSDSIYKIAEAMVDADLFKVLEIVPVRGHLYDNNTMADGFVPAVITQFTEKNLFGNESGIGKIIIKKETGTRVKIVGITDRYFHNKRRLVGQHNMIFTPLTNGMADCMLIKFEEGTNLADLEKAIDKAVASNIKNSTGFESLLIDRQSDENTNATKAFSLVFGLVVLNIIIGYWVINWYHIRRRKHEMGVRMSMGASRKRVKQKVIMEGIWICLTACLIGAIIVFNIMSVSGSISYSDLTLALIGASFQSILMSLGTTFWAAQQAARVQPIEALAEE